MSVEDHGGEPHVKEPPVSAAPSSDARSDNVDITWELSKENVLPLARGRKTEAIKRAFGAAPGPPTGARDEEPPEHSSQEAGELQGGAGTGSAEVLAALKRCGLNSVSLSSTHFCSV